MTNGWVDIKNTDMMLIMGGNPAENHPCGYKWVIEARLQRNAKTLVVDPRFTRTAATADMHVQIRVASDIAFLGGLINYAIDHNRIAWDYVVQYTNASFIVKDGFKLPEDGLYSGWDEAKRVYDKSTWNYEQGGNVTPHGASPVTMAGGGVQGQAGPARQRGQGGQVQGEAGQAAAANQAPSHPSDVNKPSQALTGLGYAAQGPAGAKGTGTASSGPSTPATLPPNVAYDLSLQHPRCVFQLLKRQYSRYTPEMVERITGAPKDQLLKAWDFYTSIRKNGDMKPTGTIIYAVGWTQHSSGTQTIKAAALLQLLLGNVGRSGGGVNALRGHSNIQGATDIAGIFDILPGYLKMPSPDDKDIATYLKRTTPTSSKPAEWDSFNYWSNTPKFAVSFLKAMYGDAAKKENDWAFHYLPKIDRNYSWTQIWDDMYDGKVKGLFAIGMNGVQIGPNSTKNIAALKKADWLVVGELYPDETSEFWRAPGTTADEMKQINTTVYRLPCAGFAEKDGTFVNSARWLQWKHIAMDPPAECRRDQDIIAQIFLTVRDLYQNEGGAFPDPILNLRWPYTKPHAPGLDEVAKEINGQALGDLTDPTGATIKKGQQLPGFAWLRDDGTTLCGNWIYSGCWTEAGNMAARRGTEDPSGLGLAPNWAWSWPANRRVLYNRASCDVSGKPWDPARALVWWNQDAGRWVGNDVPDFKVDSKPSDHMGPFIMNPEGIGRIFGPLSAFADGPFPEHYEPTESPILNPLHAKQSNNPVARRLTSSADKFAQPSDGYTIVCTTYRLTEHYHYWTKNNPMNVELVPEPFVEIPAELANELGISGGDHVKVSSIRSYYVGRAMVTRRIKPMVVDGKKTWQIGIPIHWGYRGIAEDAGRTALTSVNRLSPGATDPNAYTPEFKGFLVKLEKV